MLIVVRIWILLSTILIGAGWLLSVVHQLNRTGYLVILAMAGAIAMGWLKRQEFPVSHILGPFWRKSRKRFRRGAPRLFLGLAILTLISGSLYPALNYDANGYRLPRIFHWLAENHWHFIFTGDERLNISACGYEWLATPLVAFSHSDRLIFLINWISFLLMPGLIFSVFLRLQIRPRVAWWWMWFLSAGWCFIFQAGSVANDSFAAVYVLAAVDLALRANEKSSIADLWLSGLAAALVTGTKQTSIPLAALWLIAAWPARHLIRRHWFASLVMLAVGLLVSVLPISLLNWHYLGSWMPLNSVGFGSYYLNPFWGAVGNAFALPVQNLLPPFYELLPPFYDSLVPAWNDLMAQFLQTSLGSHFFSFENFGHLIADVYPGIGEGNAGIGLGVCLVLLAALYEGRRLKKIRGIPSRNPWRRFKSPLLVAPWLLLLIFMAKVETYENARQLAPYYPLLFPLMLAGTGSALAARSNQWQKFGLAVLGFACLLVITDSARPLFPAQTLMTALEKKFPHSYFVEAEAHRYRDNFYRAIGQRRQWLAQTLPPEEKTIGFLASLSCNADEPGIWLPWGRHEGHWISLKDAPATLRDNGIHHVIILKNIITQSPMSLNDILTKYNASVVATCPYFTEGSSQSSSHKETIWFYLLRLN
jgi:hypothetical protein